MKDYEKMINTVNAIQKAFGASEFCARDYQRELGSKTNCYCASKVCNASTENIMVKKVREEDFITRDDYGRKIVGTRYFYEVNTDFIKQLKDSLYKEVDGLYEDIESIKSQIKQKERRIAEKKEQIKLFETIINA